MSMEDAVEQEVARLKEQQARQARVRRLERSRDVLELLAYEMCVARQELRDAQRRTPSPSQDEEDEAE